MATTTATVQKQFRASIKAVLADGVSSDLLRFTEFEPNAVGSTVTFNRLASSTTSNDVDIYASGYSGIGGNTSAKECALEQVISHDFLKKDKLFKTNVDLKSAYVKSFKKAIAKGIDDLVIVEAAKSTTVAGDVSADMASNYKALVEKIAFITALADTNDEYVTNVAVVMNKADYASLFAITEFTSSDYSTMLGTGKVALAGAQLIPSDAAPKGTVYIIAKDAIGAAQWKGADDAKMEEIAGKNGFYLEAATSGGAVLIDTTGVVKFSLKP